MKVSVVIPSYNKGRSLLRAIDSAIKVLDDNCEIIVVDDKSTDGSIELAEDVYSSSACVKLVKKEHNSGPADARKLGFKHASHDWVAFLDADDEYLEGARDFFTVISGVNFSNVGAVHGVSEKSGKVCLRDRVANKVLSYSSPLWWLLIQKPNMSNLALNKNIISADEFESLGWGEDVFLYFKIVRYGAARLPILVSRYNVQPGTRGDAKGLALKVETFKKIFSLAFKERSPSMFICCCAFSVRSVAAHCYKAFR